MIFTVRKDAFSARQSKIPNSWCVAFFDGAVPASWEEFPFQLDAEGIYNNAKSCQLFKGMPVGNTLRLDGIDVDDRIGTRPFGNVKSVGEKFKVFPSKVTLPELVPTSLGYATTYSHLGGAFSFNLEDPRTETAVLLPHPAVDSEIVFEFDQPISPSAISIETDANTSACLRDFEIDYWDETLLEGAGDWALLLSDSHYANRAKHYEYNLTQSTSTKYRFRPTSENGYNSGLYPIPLEQLHFYVDDAPVSQGTTFEPTYCLVFPLHVSSDSKVKGLPLVVASVSGPAGEGDLVIDRDSYSEGQDVFLLSRSFKTQEWGVL